MKKITRIVIHIYFSFEILRVRSNRLKPNVQIKCLMRLRNRTPNWLGKISGRRIKTFMLSDDMMWIINQISCYKLDMQANVHPRRVCKTDSPLRRYIPSVYRWKLHMAVFQKNFNLKFSLRSTYNTGVATIDIKRQEYIHLTILN